MQQQLTLSLTPRDEVDFQSYWPGPNATVVEALRSLATSGHGGLHYLWGPPGIGRTHLLQAVCLDWTRRGERAAYLPLATLRRWEPEAIDGFASHSLLAIDDVGTLAGQRMWEQALRHLLFEAIERGTPVLVAGAANPAELGLIDGELVRLLAWGEVYELHLPDRSGRLDLLRLRSRQHGLELTDAVLDHMETRAGGRLDQLWTMLRQLERVAPAARRQRPGIDWVRQVLDGGGAGRVSRA